VETILSILCAIGWVILALGLISSLFTNPDK
jgi:hypothetical protein